MDPIYSSIKGLQCIMIFFSFQIDPYSVAAKDGRLREGDQIVQVNLSHWGLC